MVVGVVSHEKATSTHTFYSTWKPTASQSKLCRELTCISLRVLVNLHLSFVGVFSPTWNLVNSQHSENSLFVFYPVLSLVFLICLCVLYLVYWVDVLEVYYIWNIGPAHIMKQYLLGNLNSLVCVCICGMVDNRVSWTGISLDRRQVGPCGSMCIYICV